MKKIVLGISGATGSIYGIKLLEALKVMEDVETHLILSNWAKKNIEIETSYTVKEVLLLADIIHDLNNLGAPVASGSFLAEAMVIIPCSMKTLSSLAHGYSDNLITRSADVMLKERRRLIVGVRETPLNSIQLENMLKVSQAGAIVTPPVPSFYNHPKTLEDIINHYTGRILDLLGLNNDLIKRWEGTNQYYRCGLR